MNKKRILLIDDEIGFTRLLKLNLEQTQDYEVRVVNWPETALSVARDFRPDLVLLDIIMPCVVGSDLAKWLRADSIVQSTPIVFLTAGASRKGADSQFEPGDDAEDVPCIFKPATVEELIAGIEKHLPQNPVTEEGNGETEFSFQLH
jgi:DNA-binding response OmpR family regulator